MDFFQHPICFAVIVALCAIIYVQRAPRRTIKDYQSINDLKAKGKYNDTASK